MMITTRYLHILLRAIMVFVWTPAVAFAAAVITPDSPLNVPPMVFLLCCVFSTLSGVTTLAIRINKQLDSKPGKPLPRPWLYCGGHMGGSWMAGSLAFFGAQSYHLDVWQAFALVLMASFGGATFIEYAIKKYLPGYPMSDTGPTVPADLGGK